RKPKELAVLIEVAAWREREAQERDVPRGRVLKDDVIGDIAVQAPTTTERLAALRSLPKGFERSKWGEAIVEGVRAGLARDPKTLPRVDRPRPPINGQATVELLKVLLRMTAERHGVAAKVIATVDDLDRIAADDEADVPALSGWRRELFGNKALALKQGRLSLEIEKGRVVAGEREKGRGGGGERENPLPPPARQESYDGRAGDEGEHAWPHSFAISGTPPRPPPKSAQSRWRARSATSRWRSFVGRTEPPPCSPTVAPIARRRFPPARSSATTSSAAITASASPPTALAPMCRAMSLSVAISAQDVFPRAKSMASSSSGSARLRSPIPR